MCRNGEIMKIAFLGDIAFIGKYDFTENRDAENRLEVLAEKLSEFDYVIANLETPFTDRDKSIICKSMHLKSAPINVELLKYLHINAVSLANNHTCDFGINGLKDTIAVLENNQIEWFGANSKSLLQYINGEYISFSGYCCYSTNGTGYMTGRKRQGINHLTYDRIMMQLELDREREAFSCLSIHWGDEYTNYPNYEHICLAKKIARQKDVVICGHHPHVIQGIQKINHSVVSYSLGNCLFDDCVSITKRLEVRQTNENRKFYILEVEIEDGVILGQKYHGMQEDEKGLVNFDITEELYKISQALNEINDIQEYKEKRNEQIHKVILKKFGKHNLVWYRNRLNYYSIGAYISAIIRKIKYLQVVRNFVVQTKKLHKKKILYIGNFFFPFGNAAGKRVYTNGKILRELGYEVIYIGMDQKVSTSEPLKNTKNVYDGFTYYNFSYPKHNIDWLNYRKEFKKLINLLTDETILEDLGLVIYYGEPRLSFFLTKLIRYCRQRSIKIVSDCVDWLTTKTHHYLFDLFKWMNNTYEMLYANKKVDGIIAISSYLASYYENQCSHIVVIPPLSLFNQTISKPEITNDKIVITYAGLPFRKGQKIIDRNILKDRIDKTIILLYEAKKRGCRFICNIYGFTKEEYLKVIPMQKYYLDRLESSVVFHGYKQNDEVLEYVKCSDFTILIRDVNRDTTAGFPTKVSESISCGTPAITTKTSDLEYYIVEGKNGFFLDTTKKKNAVDELVKILSMDREEINRMKQYCAQSQLFYYKNYVKQMKDFLNKVYDTQIKY